MSNTTTQTTQGNEKQTTSEKPQLKNGMRTKNVAIMLSLNTQAIDNKTIGNALSIDVTGDDGVNTMTCLEDVCRFEKISALEFKANPALTLQRNIFTNVINMLTELEIISEGASQSLLEQRGINKIHKVKHGAKGGSVSYRR